MADSLQGVTLRDVPLDGRPFRSFPVGAGLAELLEGLSGDARQEVYPVLDGSRLVGIITLEDLIGLASQPHLAGVVNAADVMRPPITLRQRDDVRVAFEAMLAQGVRELPATDETGAIIGFVDETSIAHAYMAARGKASTHQAPS